MDAFDWVGLVTLVVSAAAIVLCAPAAFRVVHRPAPTQHWCRNCGGTGIQFRRTTSDQPEIVFCEDVTAPETAP